MDGIEAFRQLRTQGFQMPIIALTANVMKNDIDEYLKIGFNKVVGKPFRTEDFVDALDVYFI
jgi:CheY-like chemotaxis protein